MSTTNKLAALHRRRTYLAERIAGRFGNAPFATSEYGALSWALPILEAVAERNAAEAHDVHRASREASYAWLANVATQELARLNPALAADLLGQVANEGVRRAVLRSIERHSTAGLADDLRERLSIRT
jgi:hypothetical protein